MPDPVIENIYDLLDLVRQRPAMYLGSLSISALSPFITGYQFGHNYGNSDFRGKEEPPFRHFTQWLGRGFGRDGGLASYDRILKSEALFVDLDEDAAALDMFFKFLDEFRERQLHMRAHIDFETTKKSKFSREYRDDARDPEELPLSTTKVTVIEYIPRSTSSNRLRDRYTRFSPGPEFYLSYDYVNQYGDSHTSDDYFRTLEESMKRCAEEFDFDISEWIVD